MKKIFIFMLMLINSFCLCNCYQNKCVYALNIEKTTYAKALAGCTLYKDSSLNDSIENVYFVIPETYFVVVLDNISDTCMKVQYDKFIGFVNSSTVIVSTFIPIVKTLEGISCDIKETAGTQVWSQPSSNGGKILTTISSGAKNIKYVAYAFGDIPSGGESNLWYYISYTPSTNSTNVYEGYVYSENVTNLSEIVANTESNPEIINQDLENFANKSLNISSSFKTVLIAFVSIPIILLISIILYKFVKKIKENTKYNKIENNLNNIQTMDNNVYSPSDELKNKLTKFSQLSFVKKNNNHKNNRLVKNKQSSYPEFPSYNSEDDLL